MSALPRTSQWLRTMNVPAGGEAVEHYTLTKNAQLIDVRFGAELEACADLKLQISIDQGDVFMEPLPLPMLEVARGAMFEAMREGQRLTVRLSNSGRANIEARPFVIYNTLTRGLALPEAP